MLETEFYEAFKIFFQVYPIDRTGHFAGSTVVPYTDLYPIPAKDPLLTNDIAVLMSRRALELKDSLVGKSIYLMWSGGIDSTSVFYAMVEAGVTFTVLLSDTSYKEYPMLASLITNNTFNGVAWSDIYAAIPAIDYANSIIITGEIADQNIGNVMFSNMTQEMRMANYKEYIPTAFWEYTDPVVALVVDDMTTCTAGQYVWALNFTLKYAKVMTRIKDHFGGLENAVFDHFFTADYFQQWAMNNSLANSSFGAYKEYKLPLKSYIYAKNNDESYFIHKTKVPSLRFNDNGDWILRRNNLQAFIQKNAV